MGTFKSLGHHQTLHGGQGPQEHEQSCQTTHMMDWISEALLWGWVHTSPGIWLEVAGGWGGGRGTEMVGTVSILSRLVELPMRSQIQINLGKMKTGSFLHA